MPSKRLTIYFDHPANSFWERYGRRAVERLALTSQSARARPVLWQWAFGNSGRPNGWTNWISRGH